MHLVSPKAKSPTGLEREKKGKGGREQEKQAKWLLFITQCQKWQKWHLITLPCSIHEKSVTGFNPHSREKSRKEGVNTGSEIIETILEAVYHALTNQWEKTTNTIGKWTVKQAFSKRKYPHSQSKFVQLPKRTLVVFIKTKLHVLWPSTPAPK
jgi:hypothetical protein